MKNEYIQTIVLAAILFLGVFAFWVGLTVILRTGFPLLAVASGSMEPVLYRGDLIIVQGGLNFTELNAAPKDAQNPGEIIIFYDPLESRPPIYLPVAGEVHLIVHRAISKVENNGTWYFQTKGDNNFYSDRWTGPETLNYMISEKLVVGKVVGKVPWLGYIPLFMHENPTLAILIIVFLFAVFIIVDLIFPQKEDEKTKSSKGNAVKRLPSKKVLKNS